MKRNFRLCLLVAALPSLFLSTTAHAAAFQFYELGTPIIGTAAVGQAAVANDASTSYFNPAGMAQLNASQFMIGSQMMAPGIKFSTGPSNTIAGVNGGNASMLTPGVDFYYVYNYAPKVKFGVSVETPYAGMLNYTDGWVGRYIVQDMTFYAIDFNPAVSYTVNQWVSLGAGITLEYANLSQTVALPISATDDGQAAIKVSNWAPGFNIGALFTPYPTTKIGIAYRSRILHNLSGNTTFLKIATKPATSTKMIMPQSVIVSLDQAITDRVNVLGELGWANWQSMRSSVITIDGYTASTPLDWNNTYRVGIGAQFMATPAVTLQAGTSYDSSPTSSTLRTPNLPMDKQFRFAAGIMYAPYHAVKLGLSYEYLNFGNAPINNTSYLGTLQGNYSRNYANVLQASINMEV